MVGGKRKQRELEEEDLEKGGLDGGEGEENNEEAESNNKSGDKEKRGSDKEVGKSEKSEESEAKKKDGDGEKEGKLEDEKHTKIKNTLPMKNASGMGLGKQKDIPGRPHCFISSYFFLIFHLCYFVGRTCSSNTKKDLEETTTHSNACCRCLESGIVCTFGYAARGMAVTAYPQF